VTIALAAVDPCYSCTERMAVTRDARTNERLMSGDALLNLSVERTHWFEKQMGVEPFDVRWEPKLRELLT